MECTSCRVWGMVSPRQEHPGAPTEERELCCWWGPAGRGDGRSGEGLCEGGGGLSLTLTPFGLFADSSAIRELEGAAQDSVSSSKSSCLALTSRSGIGCP